MYVAIERNTREGRTHTIAVLLVLPSSAVLLDGDDQTLTDGAGAAHAYTYTYTYTRIQIEQEHASRMNATNPTKKKQTQTKKETIREWNERNETDNE